MVSQTTVMTELSTKDMKRFLWRVIRWQLRLLQDNQNCQDCQNIRINKNIRTERIIRPSLPTGSTATISTARTISNMELGTYLKWKKITRETSSETNDRPWPIITR